MSYEGVSECRVHRQCFLSNKKIQESPRPARPFYIVVFFLPSPIVMATFVVQRSARETRNFFFSSASSLLLLIHVVHSHHDLFFACVGERVGSLPPAARRGGLLRCHHPHQRQPPPPNRRPRPNHRLVGCWAGVRGRCWSNSCWCCFSLSRSCFSRSAIHKRAARQRPSATVLNLTPRPLRATPPFMSQRDRFLHCDTSKSCRSEQPSRMASTPVPVTRTHPRTDRYWSSSRCSEMERSDESDTADPQNARLRCVSDGQPRATTSVAVSESAQQKDCTWLAPTARHMRTAGLQDRVP